MADSTEVPTKGTISSNAASDDGAEVKDQPMGRFSSIDYQNDVRQAGLLCHEFRKVREDLKNGLKPAGFEDLLQCLADEEFWMMAQGCLPILRGGSDTEDLESTTESAACVADMQDAAKEFIPEFRRRREARWRAMGVNVEELNRSVAASEEDRRSRRVVKTKKPEILIKAIKSVRADLKNGVKPDDFEDLLRCLANEDFWGLTQSQIPFLCGGTDLLNLESNQEAADCVAAMKEAAISGHRI
ncbi:hypothetical protein LTR56_010945 [Elasticomyces elasticus]|nr:hypothetical protein LTR56_010945 [Elasticomyces elasticus]KAK3662644.1 hypothetical protein LTR22_006494 [Elasticomyces elasticus]KAK4926572.1 hypothetical protein LTR49_006506 [Elasticomyces elasticus]KAK5760665.1 hypothetical protein LTS12_009202 [Elasticomyces elasticus]